MSKLYVREPDDAARSRGAAIAGGGMVLALVAGLAWLLNGPPEPSEDAAARAPSKKPPSSTAAKAVAAAPIASSASAAFPPGQTEVCGLGLVSESEWSRPARRDAFQASVQATRLRTIATLKTKPDPLAQGLALAMESRGAEAVIDEAARCTGLDCPVTPAKTDATTIAQPRASAPREALARLAQTSQSPELYGLAWRVCAAHGAQDSASACRMLSAEQWAQLDPDNAMPWAGVLERARAQRDGSAVSAALYRMSLSRTIDGRTGRLPGLVLASVPAGTPALETEAVVADVVAREGEGWSQKMSSLSTEECTAAAVRDTERWQRCDAWAQTLWQQGRKTTDLATAIRIGKAIGWPAERLQGMQDEAAALSLASSEALLGSSRSCDAVRRRTGHLDESGRLGEVAWARRIIATSRMPMTQWTATARSKGHVITEGTLPASVSTAAAQTGAKAVAP